MTRRETVIMQLLERYDELVDPMQSRSGIGDGDRLPLMPPTYTASVRELERLLKRMRTERPKQYRHLNARYIQATTVTRDIPVKRKAKNGKTITTLERQPVCVYPAWVRNHTVEQAIEWLATHWNHTTEPMLPTELLLAA